MAGIAHEGSPLATAMQGVAGSLFASFAFLAKDGEGGKSRTRTFMYNMLTILELITYTGVPLGLAAPRRGTPITDPARSDLQNTHTHVLGSQAGETSE